MNRTTIVLTVVTGILAATGTASAVIGTGVYASTGGNLSITSVALVGNPPSHADPDWIFDDVDSYSHHVAMTASTVTLTAVTVTDGTRVGDWLKLTDDDLGGAYDDFTSFSLVDRGQYFIAGTSFATDSLTINFATPCCGGGSLLASNSASSTATFQFTVVPEPATMGLLALGSLGLAALRRRRK